MSLSWLSALRYGSGPTTWTSTIPSAPFTEPRQLIGGTFEAAGGARTAFTIATRRLLRWTFRVSESEMAAFRAAIEYGMAYPGALTFYPNGTGHTGYAVYVISPAHGEDWEPARTDQMASASGGSVFDCPVTFRKTAGTAWDLNYYAP